MPGIFSVHDIILKGLFIRLLFPQKLLDEVSVGVKEAVMAQGFLVPQVPYRVKQWVPRQVQVVCSPFLCHICPVLSLRRSSLSPVCLTSLRGGFASSPSPKERQRKGAQGSERIHSVPLSGSCFTSFSSSCLGSPQWWIGIRMCKTNPFTLE